MNNPAAGHPGDDTGLYRIRVKGRLGSHWASWFDGVTLTAEPDGTTLLEGAVDTHVHSAPDLVEYGNTDTAGYVKDGGLADISAEFGAWPEAKDTDPTARTSVSGDGKE